MEVLDKSINHINPLVFIKRENTKGTFFIKTAVVDLLGFFYAMCINKFLVFIAF